MSNIDEYLRKLRPQQQAALQRIRHIVMQTLPEATEVISYGMPGFTYKGKYLIGFNALKHHLAIYPTSEPITLLHDKLGDFSLSRGTIRFDLAHPISGQIITELISIRVTSIDKYIQGN